MNYKPYLGPSLFFLSFVFKSATNMMNRTEVYVNVLMLLMLYILLFLNSNVRL
jgi:hypothetical protein